MNFIIKNQDTSRYLRLGYIAFALVMAVLYDLFFWKQEQGISFALFVIIYVAGFLLLTVLTDQLRQRWTLLFLVPILILTVDVVLYNNDLVHYLVTKIVFLLSVVFSLLATLANPHRHPFSFRHIPLLKHIDWLFTKWDQMYKDLFRWSGATDKDVVRKIAIGLIISLPVLFIFTALFMQADAVFSQWLGNIFDFTDTISLAWLWRIVRIVGFTVFIGSFFYCIFAAEHVLGYAEHIVLKLDRIIVGVLLALVNALFLIFVFIQFKYLFGSASFVLENGLAYADYARKGFFELAWVVALAALLVIVVYRSFVQHGISKIITALQIFLVAQVGVVAISALKRMNLYQDAYGYTVLRLYVEWAIYLILAVLVFTIISLLFKISFRKFWYTNLILGVAAFTIVATVNVDRMIAKENIDRFLQQGKELDLKYLDTLSTDILPVFHELLTQENLQKFNTTDQLYITDIYKRKVEAIAKRDNWREWHAGDFSNKYWAAPPDEQYYSRMNALEVKDQAYKVVESQAFGLNQSVCGRYIGITSKGIMTLCYFRSLQNKEYVYVLDLEKNNTLSNNLITDYQTIFSVYQRNASSTVPNVLSIVGSKTLPLMTRKENAKSDYDPRYAFFTDGRILERVPEEMKHYAYSVSVINSQIDLVKSGVLEK